MKYIIQYNISRKLDSQIIQKNNIIKQQKELNEIKTDSKKRNKKFMNDFKKITKQSLPTMNFDLTSSLKNFDNYSNLIEDRNKPYPNQPMKNLIYSNHLDEIIYSLNKFEF